MRRRDDDRGTPFPPGPVLRRLETLAADGLAAELAVRVAGARTVLLDRALLQHDFPFLRDAALARREPALARLPEAARGRAVRARLARFLEDQAGLVSRRQAGQSAVNTPIATTGEEATAYRPPDYGRALVLVARDPRDRPAGLLDVKGAGVAPRRRPSLAPHRSGLMYLGEALREAVYARLVDAALRHAGLPCRALPVYGVLDLGFDALLPSGRAVPAGLLVRRAHRRPDCRGGLKDPGSPLVALELGLELALRRYGLTSAGPMTHLTISEAAATGTGSRGAGGRTGRGVAVRGIGGVGGAGGTGGAGGIAVRWHQTPLRVPRREQAEIAAAVGFTGGTLTLEGVNIQLTREAEARRPRPQILDFGAWRARARFASPLASLVALRLLRLGEIVRPDDPRYVQPDPRLALPQGFLDVECFDLARQVRDGAVTPAALARRLDSAVDRATARWRRRPEGAGRPRR